MHRKSKLVHFAGKKSWSKSLGQGRRFVRLPVWGPKAGFSIKATAKGHRPLNTMYSCLETFWCCKLLRPTNRRAFSCKKKRGELVQATASLALFLYEVLDFGPRIECQSKELFDFVSCQIPVLSKKAAQLKLM